MVGGSRIIAFGSGSEEPQAEQHSQAGADGYGAADPAQEAWEEEAPPRSYRVLTLAILALAAIAGWTAFFAWANWPDVSLGLTPQQAIALIAAWSPPVLVACVLWLIALRTSTREASRFNDAARQLRGEAEHLEQRLSVNHDWNTAVSEEHTGKLHAGRLRPKIERTP